MEIKYLDLKYLDTLTTERLLSYYRKTYKKIRKYQNDFYCDCCGMPTYMTDSKLYSKEENKEREYEFNNSMTNSDKYLDSIKILLNNREHIK